MTDNVVVNITVNSTAVAADVTVGEQGERGPQGYPGADGIGAAALGPMILQCTASAGGGRCNNMYGVTNSVTDYQRVGGIVTVKCSSMPHAAAGKVVKIAPALRPDAFAFVLLTAVSATGDGRTQLVGPEIYVSAPRVDLPLGSVNDHTMTVHDMQSSTNTHPQVAKMIGAVGGGVEVVNCGIGSSTPTTWQNAALRAYIAGMGRFAKAHVDFGIGNAMTAPTQDCADIFGAFADSVEWVRGLVDGGVDILGVPGARLGGDGSPVTNPPGTQDYTTALVLHHYLQAFVAARYPNVKYLDAASRFERAVMYGDVDTADYTRGEPPAEFLSGADGVHLAPTGADEVAIDPAESILRDLQPYQPFAAGYPDFIGVNNVADAGGTTFNPNAIYSPGGNIATQEVDFQEIIVGTGYKNTSVNGTSLTNNMSGILEVLDGDLGGREMQLTFNDPVDGGAAVQFDWPGPDAFPFYQSLNDSRLRGGIPLYHWLQCWCEGFNQDSVGRIDFSMWATGADDGVDRKLWSWLSDDGVNTMFGAQRAWTRGFDLPLLAGGGRVFMPTRTFSRAWIRASVQGVAGIPMGTLYLGYGEQRLARGQLLAAALPGRWA